MSVLVEVAINQDFAVRLNSPGSRLINAVRETPLDPDEEIPTGVGTGSSGSRELEHLSQKSEGIVNPDDFAGTAPIHPAPGMNELWVFALQ